MKTLELDLNKRLLIVEIEMLEYVASMLIGDFFPKYELEFICKGSELTDDILNSLVDFFEHEEEILKDWYTGKVDVEKKNVYSDYKFDGFTYSALESFISAIESKNYHWGENPVEFKENEMNWEKRHKNRIDWEKAESRTFNPSKCLIFEIL